MSKGKNNGVFSDERTIIAPSPNTIFKGRPLKFNHRYQMDGIELLASIKNDSIPLVIFDPQYRGILDMMEYGNEGGRQKGRSSLIQMPEYIIKNFLAQIDRILIPKGHLFLWVDKFHLLDGVKPWITNLKLCVVDMIVWDKERMGMGYRTRKQSEYLIILQKLPLRAKDVWNNHKIRDIWTEKIANNKMHPHQKPINLQSTLIETVTNPGDVVVDPAAGSFSVLKATQQSHRLFLGTNLKLKNEDIQMSLISDRKNNSSGAYERILGNKKLDSLISKVHATTISAGRELENIIYKNSKTPIIKNEEDLKKVLINDVKNESRFIVNKKLFKIIQNGGRNQPDFIVLDTKNKKINVIELKEGTVFDTKKSEGEDSHLKEFETKITNYLKTLAPDQEPIFEVKPYFCSFHALSKEKMALGTKNKIERDFLLTNKEFCEMVNIDFEQIKKIQEVREKHQDINLKYFINSLAEIPEVVNGILEVRTAKLKEKNIEN